MISTAGLPPVCCCTVSSARVHCGKTMFQRRRTRVPEWVLPSGFDRPGGGGLFVRSSWRGIVQPALHSAAAVEPDQVSLHTCLHAAVSSGHRAALPAAPNNLVHLAAPSVQPQETRASTCVTLCVSDRCPCSGPEQLKCQSSATTQVRQLNCRC